MHKLLILSNRAPEYGALIDAAGLPELELVTTTDAISAIGFGSDCDLALADPPLLATVLPDLSRLRWAQSTWAGVETLIQPGLRRDYLLTSACDVFGRLMSEYVFGYLLALERGIIERHESQRIGRWDRTPPGTLAGKQLGLLGVGSIGSVLARTGKHFGMTVKGYTRSSEACAEIDEYVHHRAEVATFASELDYLVCMMPNTSSTRGFVDEELLRALPARAVLVNPGRGSTVDTKALASALRSGRLRAAVLDVFEEEPLPADHELWRTPNVIITFHTAALSNPRDIASIFECNYRRFLRGEVLNCRVDFDREY